MTWATTTGNATHVAKKARPDKARGARGRAQVNPLPPIQQARRMLAVGTDRVRQYKEVMFLFFLHSPLTIYHLSCVHLQKRCDARLAPQNAVDFQYLEWHGARQIATKVSADLSFSTPPSTHTGRNRTPCHQNGRGTTLQVKNISFVQNMLLAIVHLFFW